ncbi:ankyrin repeat domain-containing protein [Brachyspira hyodysenteriae]|uniref:ankyrin repeat domain-containing protein n=1 Tax=Brachyspira hyodysenteriae TaxID=159 RepID=UPI001ADD812D|nr:ankyrin repeat domain-containing protein [Brachyspira hyodysenteriae]MBT8719692.1 ankyrin repeat domain-containing protein [Brachyspira hyodysenteriae]MBT8729931.1 ankyrin repeat domain-containing protein [Brachyspira hyodysenteriae]MBT8732100.1 ankyrin repeat domain-containing protein [Brachyspira hyodysenteriae]MBT8734546.1 ankyrin repeat domain-containing protein [Brachyspira hyodysenteriae]MBT8737539.1 ankyrin repeat domain-containing protein [Brachyspira hyodysenteriae]
MKKFLFISFVLMITFIISCGKKEEDIISNANNLDNKIDTNVVKVKGKYVNMNSDFSYGNREEGEYSKDYDIFEDIENHSLKRVIELIEEGEDINQTYSGGKKYSELLNNDYYLDGATPLMFAVFYRDLGIMKYLLDKGADPNIIQDEYGRNVFLLACGFGNVDVIKMIVDFDSDLVDSVSSRDENGLDMSYLYGNIEVFEYLVNTLGLTTDILDNVDEEDPYENTEDIKKLRELLN